MTEFDIHILGEKRNYVNFCNKRRKKAKERSVDFIFQAIKHPLTKDTYI